MPENDPNPKTTPDEDAAIAARTAPAPEKQPEYITPAAFAAFQEQQRAQFEDFTTRLLDRVTPRAEAKREPEINYDSEIAKAEEEGNTGRATELRIAKATKPLLDRIGNFEQFGVTQLESISSEVVLQDAEDKKLYQRYKKEVDGVRAGMPANFRTSPESLRTALTFVKGQHLNELLAEKSEAIAREAAGRKDTTGATPSNTESSRGKKPDRLPTPEEHFKGNEATLAQIEALGGPDKYVQKVSGGKYRDWNSWITKTNKLYGLPIPEKKAS